MLIWQGVCSLFEGKQVHCFGVCFHNTVYDFLAPFQNRRRLRFPKYSGWRKYFNVCHRNFYVFIMRARCIKYSKMFRKRRLRTLENMYYHSESSFPYELSINLKLEKFSKNMILGRMNIVNVRMDRHGVLSVFGSVIERNWWYIERPRNSLLPCPVRLMRIYEVKMADERIRSGAG